MRKIISISFAAAAAILAMQSAQATVVLAGDFSLEDKGFGSQSGIHFDGNPTGPSVTGYINQDDSGVSFSTTTGSLSVSNGSGQAVISGDPLIENLNVAFDNAWDDVTFNFEGDAGSFQLLVNGSALFTGPACTICTIGNGANRFTVSGAGITSLEFTFNPGIASTRQFRVDGVTAVPEPATWAMMVIGLGFAGGMMRRRVSKVQFA